MENTRNEERKWRGGKHYTVEDNSGGTAEPTRGGGSGGGVGDGEAGST